MATNIEIQESTTEKNEIVQKPIVKENIEAQDQDTLSTINLLYGEDALELDIAVNKNDAESNSNVHNSNINVSNPLKRKQNSELEISTQENQNTHTLVSKNVNPNKVQGTQDSVSENNKDTKDKMISNEGEEDMDSQNDNDIESINSSNPAKRKCVRTAKKKKLDNACSAEVDDDNLEYYLTVTNLPNSWSFIDIKNYIDMQCGPVDEIEMLTDDNSAIRLSYQTEEECNQAMTKLNEKEVEGKKLIVEKNVEVLNSDNENNETQSESIPENTDAPRTLDKTWRPDIDPWEIDPTGMYGLKMSFLDSLGIKPPLDKWVKVSNFFCDSSEIKDVVSLAGQVLMFSVFFTSCKFAKVMYSHPLEAVQAVSMLNGKSMYGRKLKVMMEWSPAHTYFLPKGLFNIGTGFGPNGKPLRSIVKHYQRFVTDQSVTVNSEVFEYPKNFDPSKAEQTEVTFTVENVEFLTNELRKRKKKIKNTKTAKSAPTNSIVQNQPKPASPSTTAKNDNAKPIVTIEEKASTPPAKIPVRQNGQPENNFQQRNLTQNLRNIGPRPTNAFGPRPMGPMRPNSMGPSPTGPRHMGPRPMGPGSMGPRPMGPRPIGPGPMGPGIMGPRHMGPRPMGPGPMENRPMGPGPISHGPMGHGPMGHGPTGHGPMGHRPMGHGPKGQGPMGQGPMGQGPMGHGQLGHGPMGHGPMGHGPMGHGPMGHGPMGHRPMGPAPINQGPMGHVPIVSTPTQTTQIPGQMLGNTLGPMSGQMPRPMQGQTPGGLQICPGNEPVQLQLSNLPPSTTFAILCEKMAQCGAIVAIQLTTPGCAVVTFANRMQADHCFKTYHNVTIEGHAVQVKYTL